VLRTNLQSKSTTVAWIAAPHISGVLLVLGEYSRAVLPKTKAGTTATAKILIAAVPYLKAIPFARARRPATRRPKKYPTTRDAALVATIAPPYSVPDNKGGKKSETTSTPITPSASQWSTPPLAFAMSRESEVESGLYE
jgi:hypothetical protein